MAAPSAYHQIKPLITIIIPTLNSIHVIDKALNSILVQSFTDFEIILSDGNSSDGTVQHATQRLLKASIAARFIIAPGAGIYAAMNQAAQLAQGAWLFYMGSDDALFAPDTLQAIAPVLMSTRADVVHGDAWIEDPGYFYGGDFPLDRLIEKNFSHQSAFYRLKTLRRHEITLDEKYKVYADWDCNLRLLACGRFHYVPQPIACFGCEGISGRLAKDTSLREKIDDGFLKEKEANAIRYFGFRSFWLLSLDRLALGCAAKPSLAKSSLFMLSRSIRSPISWLVRKVFTPPPSF